jgi:hypothetical protein
MLYHYTNFPGLLGILGSQSIWASSCSYLNDSTEFNHSLGFAKQIAGGIFENDDYPEAFGWQLRHGLESLAPEDLYVASFSEKGDLLSQWRGYCPSGAGVSIGFDRSALDSYCTDHNYRFSKCIYDHEAQVLAISTMVQSCLEIYPKPSVSRGEYELLSSKDKLDWNITYRMRTAEGAESAQAESAIQMFSEKLFEVAPLFKNFGFHEETEWRIVAYRPSEEQKFRTGPSYLIPYIEIPFIKACGGEAIREIVIGPNPDQRRCAASIERLLISRKLGHVGIRMSSIPFSAW